jgi:DMSO reductase family type II enzyme chaperone
VTAQAYSKLYRLAALGLAHPVPELHERLRDGSFQREVARCARAARLDIDALPPVEGAFEQYEADYIALFQHGPAGPACSLYETDHVTGGGSRGERLVELTRFYRFFGLETALADGARDQPDHIVCELEMMAFLAHREATAHARGQAPASLRLAERDFLGRRLAPCLDSFAARAAERSATLRLAPFLPALATVTRAIGAQHLRNLTGTSALPLAVA